MTTALNLSKNVRILHLPGVIKRFPALDGASMQTAAAELETEYARAIPFNQMPSPKGYPIIGNALDLAKKENMANFLGYHSRLVKELGNTYRLRLPGKDFVFIKDPADARTLLNNDGKYPFVVGFEPFELLRKGPLSQYSDGVPGLLGQGEDWHSFRVAVQQDLMRPKSALFYINDLEEIMEEVYDKLEETADENQEVDGVGHLMNEFALESVGVMFIGTKFGVLKGSEDGQKMIKSAIRIFELFFLAAMIPPVYLPYSATFRTLVREGEITAEIIKRKVLEAIEADRLDGSLEGTVLGKMLAKHGEQSIIPMLVAMDALNAGIETTGNQGTFLLYHLATNPDKQERLSEEIRRVVGPAGKMTEEKLAQMKYLKACQTESQRMAPVANATIRKTNVDLVLGGYQVPKGTVVVRHGALNSLDSKYYPHPDKFIPERWIRGSGEYSKVDPFANLPFGHGPRACIGQRFARLELQMLAMKIVQKYRLEYHGEPVQIDYTGLGHADRKVKIKFIKR